MDRNRSEIFRDKVGFKNLLIELEDKLLQWFGNIKTRTPRKALELTFKGQRLME
jgi:hypothetical protein